MWLAAGWLQVIVVIVLGIIPSPPALGHGMDWVGHFLEFVVLMTWFGGFVTPERHLYVAAALILLGISIEIMQAASIFRHFDLWDIAANTAGVLTGLLLVRTVLRNWCQRVETILGGSRS